MAEVKFEYGKSYKKRLTLKDCKIGDIVRLHKNKKVYIITGNDSSLKLVSMLNLCDVELKNYDEDTLCSYYTEPLKFYESSFQEYVD